jgi:hypothetical protein
MRHTWSRLKRIAGVPSLLVVCSVFAFYLLVNAVTWEAAELGGGYGVWAATAAAIAATAFLFIRWQARVAPALAPTLGRPGSAKLSARRGVIVVVGLDSAEPGVSFLRLLAAAQNLEYLGTGDQPAGRQPRGRSRAAGDGAQGRSRPHL